MVKRKKRLEKGIKSLIEQIRIHQEKKKQAINDNNLDLVKYYEKEIPNLEAERIKKQHQINKKKRK